MMTADHPPPPWDRLKKSRPRLMSLRYALGCPPGADVPPEWLQRLRREGQAATGLGPARPWAVPPAVLATQDLGAFTAAAAASDPNKYAKALVREMRRLCYLWLLDPQEWQVSQARRLLLEACALPDWAPDVFLATGRIAYGVAIGYDMFWDELGAGDRALIEGSLMDKAILPALDQIKLARPFWATEDHNWTIVCNAGLMAAAMAIADSRPAPTWMLYGWCLDAMQIGLLGYYPDGAWREGPGYWGTAAEYLVYLLQALLTGFGSAEGLDQTPGLSDTSFYRRQCSGPSGLMFNYADSEAEPGPIWPMEWLARYFGQPTAPCCEPVPSGPLDPDALIWASPARLERGQPLPPLAARFRQSEAVMMRGGWDEMDTYVAIKGGHNRPDSHQHFDAGSFVLDARGQRWALDLGPDAYEIPNYFTQPTRSQLYRTATCGHNTLVIGGHCEATSAAAPITRFAEAADASFAVLDLTQAYQALASAYRGCVLIGGRDVLIVDEVEPAPVQNDGAAIPVPVTWQMHTTAQIEPVPGDPARAVLYMSPSASALFVQILSPAGAGFTTAQAAPTYLPHRENPNAGVTKLMVALGVDRGRARLAVLLSPQGFDVEVPERFRAPLLQWH